MTMKPWLRFAPPRPPQEKSSNSVPPAAPSPLIALQLAGGAHWTAQNFSGLAREGYQRNAIAYRCIRLISEAAASVPLQVRRSSPVRHDPVITLLRAPNPSQSRIEFFEAFYGYLQLSGDSFIEAAILDNQPVALFNLRPDRMRALKDKRGWPCGWEYQAGGQKRRIRSQAQGEKNPVFHMRLFHPTDDIYGFSPLQAAAKAVDVHNAGSTWTKALLDNSARPSGALIYKGASGAEHLSTEQFDRLKAELERRHTGAETAGRPLLLEGGLDWKAMSLSPADMDFINAKREATREIALAFGVPPMLLGIPGDNTYANYKEANLAFWRQTILPLVRKMSDSLGLWLSNWFGEDLHLYADEDSIAALSAERAARWTALSAIDFMSVDEKRERAGLPPLETGGAG